MFANVGKEAEGVGGDLTIETGRLSVSNKAEISATTFGRGDAGNLTVRASDSVEVSNGRLFAQVNDKGAEGAGGNLTIETGQLTVSGDDALIVARTFGEGNAGNLTVDTGELNVRDGAQLSTSTHGIGDAGNLTVRATEVELIGTTADGQYPSGLFAQVNGKDAEGAGGNLTVETERLIVRGGGKVSVNTFGLGAAGTLEVRASDSVEVIGSSSRFASGLESAAQSGATGAGGNLTVETRRLIVKDGALVFTGTFGLGAAGTLEVRASDSVEVIGSSAVDQYPSSLLTSVNEGATGAGGNLTVETRRLAVRDGARVSTATFGEGSAGTLEIKARESVEVSGTSTNGQGSRLTTRTESIGDAGDLTIETGQLTLWDEAEVTVGSQGLGNAGNLDITARSIRLENQALVSSNTTAGQGNINLRSEDLVLRRGSNITTNATGTATGGNITINTGVLAALENSDITANADEASGGQVIINAQGIFGTEFRNQPTSESDITASSNRGPQFSGSVEINTSNVDLNQGLIALPVELVNVEGLIANSCIARSSEQGGNFNITGAGGLPTRPGDAAISPYPTGTVRSIPNNDASSSSSQSGSVQSTNKARRWKIGDPIVEPQGVYRLANGELVLSRECSD